MGWLRVAASVGYGRLILMPRVQSFLEQHPAVRIDLRLSDGCTDLIEQGIDVAVRLGALPDSSLVARKIGNSRRVLVANPSYFERLPGGGPPLDHPRDLAAHNCIVYTEVTTQNAWEFQGRSGEIVHVRVAGNLQTNSSEVIRAAALSGLGICHVPDWLLSEELASGSRYIARRLIRRSNVWERSRMRRSDRYAITLPSDHVDNGRRRKGLRTAKASIATRM